MPETPGRQSNTGAAGCDTLCKKSVKDEAKEEAKEEAKDGVRAFGLRAGGTVWPLPQGREGRGTGLDEEEMKFRHILFGSSWTREAADLERDPGHRYAFGNCDWKDSVACHEPR